MKTEAIEHVIQYGSRRIPYRLRRSDRRRLRIVVKPDLTVTANAPRSFSELEILDAVQAKAKWVAKQVASFETFHPLPTPHKFISGETFVYLGRQYRLKVAEGERTPAKLRGRYLHVTVPDKKNSPAVKKAVDVWYRTRADEVFRRYLEACMTVASRHGIEVPTLVIRDMRTRWGSCSASGRVTLNLKLTQAPVHCIEYVVMHELCHMVHHNHSPAFYRLLTRCMPDWERRKAILDKIAIANDPRLHL